MIYYAHSKTIYNTKREEMELDAIMKYFNVNLNSIINPKDWFDQTLSEEEIMIKCKDCVENFSNGLVFSTYEVDKPYISRGVAEEILTAWAKNILTFIIDSDLTIRPYNQLYRVLTDDEGRDNYHWAEIYGYTPFQIVLDNSSEI